jgi:membrane protein implicated in regulation of membrane protease activity
MKRVRILAGGIAAVGIAASAMTGSLIWNAVAVVAALALLLAVLLERRHRIRQVSNDPASDHGGTSS